MNLRLGMLTPSSNTVLEPMTAAMLAKVPSVTAHFSRFPVTEIALSPSALGQFDEGPILRAAELLAHAKVDVIVWNGTSAAWLGFESDERLCKRIEAATGIRATSAVLGFRAAFTHLKASRIGLVTPYLSDVQERIVANWGASGLTCVAERHLALQDNFSFAQTPPDAIAEMVRQVAAEGCNAIAIVCTNLCGARIAPILEAEIGLPVLDSVAVALSQALCLGGARDGLVKGWGQCFR